LTDKHNSEYTTIPTLTASIGQKVQYNLPEFVYFYPLANSNADCKRCTEETCGTILYQLVPYNGNTISSVGNSLQTLQYGPINTAPHGYLNPLPTERAIVLHSTNMSDLNGATSKEFKHKIVVWSSLDTSKFVEKVVTMKLTGPCTMTQYTIDRAAVPEKIKYDIDSSAVQLIYTFSASYLPSTCKNHKPFKAIIKKFASATDSTPLPTEIAELVDGVDVGIWTSSSPSGDWLTID